MKKKSHKKSIVYNDNKLLQVICRKRTNTSLEVLTNLKY